jgi:DNA-binding NarL/FixJ family response regulator
LRLILAEDSVLFRDGLDRLLREAGFDVIGHAADADRLLSQVEHDPPDVVILDIRLPPGYRDEGLRAAREIRRRWPNVGLLLLSQYAEPAYAADVIALGTRSVGYLLKDRVADVAELVDALRRVGTGRSAIDAAIIASLLNVRRRDEALERLTERERAILALMAEGRSNAGIVHKLWIAEPTVEKHVHSILTKLCLPETDADHRRVLAVLAFLNAS